MWAQLHPRNMRGNGLTCVQSSNVTYSTQRLEIVSCRSIDEPSRGITYSLSNIYEIDGNASIPFLDLVFVKSILFYGSFMWCKLSISHKLKANLVDTLTKYHESIGCLSFKTIEAGEDKHNSLWHISHLSVRIHQVTMEISHQEVYSKWAIVSFRYTPSKSSST